MIENNCNPILNIQIPDLSPDQINDLIELGKNKAITIQDIIAITSNEQQEQTPSRSPISSATSFSSPTTSNSRPSQAGGGGSPSGNQQSSQSKQCRPPQKERGAWSMPFTSHGKVQGVPIEPRELNCDCIGN